jgi:hypothetical protein
MAEYDVDQLRQAIEGLHRCSVRLVESIPVTETHNNEVVWDGIVHVFDLGGHSSAPRAYAWSNQVNGRGERRFFAVLHEGRVASPIDAARAVLAANRPK